MHRKTRTTSQGNPEHPQPQGINRNPKKGEEGRQLLKWNDCDDDDNNDNNNDNDDGDKTVELVMIMMTVVVVMVVVATTRGGGKCTLQVTENTTQSSEKYSNKRPKASTQSEALGSPPVTHSQCACCTGFCVLKENDFGCNNKDSMATMVPTPPAN